MRGTGPGNARNVAGCGLFLFLMAASLADAAVYLPMQDAVVFKRGSAAAFVTSLGSRVTVLPGGLPETRTRFAVIESLKGQLPSEIEVGVAGGNVRDGISLPILGVPRFTPGQQYVLSLVKRPDGVYAVTELSIGSFDVVEDASGRLFATRLAFRNADAMSFRVSDSGRERLEKEPVRELGRFLSALRERFYDQPAGLRTVPGYLGTAKGEVLPVRQRMEPQWDDNWCAGYTYDPALGCSPGDTVRFRWNNGAAASVSYCSEDPLLSGQSAVAGGGISQIQTAVSLWNGASSAITYGFPVARPGACDPSAIPPAGEVRIILNGLFMFGSPVRCPFEEGGVIGMGAPVTDNTVHAWKGSNYKTIRAGLAWIRAFDCLEGSFTESLFQDAVTHELGHTLGLSHADKSRSPNDFFPGDDLLSVMVSNYSAERSPNGLGTDDAGAACFLYGTCTGCEAGTILIPASAEIPAAGATNLKFELQAPGTCAWTVAAVDPWITVTPGFGSGNATVTYSVLPNVGAARIGTILAGGRVFTIRQADGCAANTVLSPASAKVPATASVDRFFNVQTGPGCFWTAISNVAWVTTVSGASGSGNGIVTYSVAANTGAARAGTITAAGKTFTIEQEAACVVPSTPQITSYPAAPLVAGNSFAVAWAPVSDLPAGGYYQVNVSNNAQCTSPLSVVTAGLAVTVETPPDIESVRCIQVRAISGSSCAPEYVSQLSAPVTVQARPLQASFVVIRGQSPAARVNLNGAPPANSTVIFRNVGRAPGTLTLSTLGGFFSTPVALFVVAAGADFTASIEFDAGSTSTSGVKTGELTGSWADGGGNRSVAATVTLSVLEGASQPTGGMKLVPVGSNLVYFRASAGSQPDSQSISVRNSGTLPVRLAPVIGPGGSWLSIQGDFISALAPGTERTFDLSVDRSRRVTADGEPPLSTTVRIDNIDGNPEDAAIFNVFDEEPPPPVEGTNRVEVPASEYSFIFPSSVSSTTGEGSRRSLLSLDGTGFLSDGWLRNRGSDAITLDLYFTPAGAQGITDPSVKKNTIVLNAYSAYRLSDFVSGLFGATGSGHVEIRSPQLPQVSVRSTVDTIVSRDGVPVQYGGEIPVFINGEGISVPEAGTVGELTLLAGLRGPLAGYRSNIICAETVGKAISVRARLYDTSGKRLGEKVFSVNPYSKTQINSIDPELFPVPYDEGTVEIEPVSGAGTVSAFATVLDNRSRSYAVRLGTVQSKVRPGAKAPRVVNTAFLPTVTSEKTVDSAYSTRVSITNGAEREARLLAVFVPEPGFGEASEPREIVIPRRDADGPPGVSYNNVLKDLLGIEANARGMLKIEGDITGLVFSSDTTTPLDPKNPDLGYSLSSLNPAPGTEATFAGIFSVSSQEVFGVKQSESDTAKPEVSLPAIEEGAQFKTNLTLAELAGEIARARIILRKTGGAALGEPLFVDLGPYERKQIDRIISTVTKIPAGDAEYKDIEIVVQAVEGKGRAIGLVTRISSDAASKRMDTYVLGPPVTNTKRGGKR